MQALGIIDYPVEPHLIPILVKLKKIFVKRPSPKKWKLVSVMSGLA